MRRDCEPGALSSLRAVKHVTTMHLPLVMASEDRTPSIAGGYLGLAEHFRSLILRGDLSPGSRLPTVREAAKQFRVGLTTVQRAYKVLGKLGLVEGRGGAGTRVAQDFGKHDSMTLLARPRTVNPMVTFERVSSNAGLRSLATSVPDPALFRGEDFFAELDSLRDASAWSWYYSPPAGVASLRSAITALLRRRGLPAEETDLMVTHGSTHALSTVLAEIAEPGQTVIIQQPGFMGGKEMFDALRLRPIGVPMLGDDIDLDRFKSAAKANAGSPVVLFPTFHPATGRSLANWRNLLEISDRYGLTAIEIDQYRHIAFEPPSLPLASVDPRVIHIDSFAYSLVGSVRMGYVVAPRPLLERLIHRMVATTMTPSAILERALGSYISGGHFDAHLKRVVPEYKRRRDALLRALEVHFPKGTSWSKPQGGFSSWVELPPGNWSNLYETALKQGVPFTPSELLLLESEPSKLRLAYGCQKPETIGGAVAALGAIVHSMLR